MTEPLDPAVGLRPRIEQDLDQRAESLRRRMHSPLCGILTSLGYLNRSSGGPAMLIGSGDLTGVHVLSGQPAPKPGSFHLGGSSSVPFESRIRVLAESLERYAGHAITHDGSLPVRRASWEELRAAGEPVLDSRAFSLFSPRQLATPGFPFEPFSPDRPIGWLSLPSLPDGSRCWIPAQWFLLGYLPADDEPWLCTAVTTGTAAHTEPGRALLAALEELIQLDATMGHWHGARPGTRIEHDRRTTALQRVIAADFAKLDPAPEFHLLHNADLPGFTVACLIRQHGGLIPRMAIGLGSGARLERAMHRALLEAAGVQWLAAWVRIQDAVEPPTGAGGNYDLESNVGFYAGPAGAAVVERRFAESAPARASDLPPDDEGGPREIVRSIVRAFGSTGKRLYWADLSTVDVRALGFHVLRAWSPDTISLSLPGAPPSQHRRFAAYGGFDHADPHPYP
ncbi:MAG: YcaO-like family protein [Actinomycetota bacterium]|nr:YcaO-like family protein [Actinomycetota bacterium]MDQ2959145.1 YcaO-like family protein [Actinomycetota bacterium]